MGENTTNIITMVLLYAVVIGGFWFFLIRPQSKKRKQENEMRNNIKIGDEIVTIGGIIGRIVSIKTESENMVIETGIDRNKINIKRWAIASVINKDK